MDKILFNGKIYTENSAQPWAQAMAIDGRKLAYVGDNDSAKALATDGTELVDLQGKTVIPAILDGHTHPGIVTKTFWYVIAPMTEDRDELFKYIKEYAAKYPKEERPYFFYDCYQTATFGEEGPNRWMFDELVNDRPARFQDFGDHACCYNTKALELLMDENGVPHNDSPVGEPIFVKNEDGEYTGWCFESVWEGDTGILEAVKEETGWEPQLTMNDEIATPLFDYFKQFGVTGLMDGFTEGEENLKYLYQLDKEDRLGMFYEGAVILVDVNDIEEVIATARDWQKKYTTDHIRINTVKFFLDGTNEMGDCLSLTPFSNDPTGTNYGEAMATMEEMRDVMVRLNKERLDFHVHVICDGAFRLMCDAVEEARKICGDDWCIKVCLAHCEVIHPDDIKRVRELGIYIDFSCHWCGGYFGDAAIRFMGEDRWNNMQAFDRIIEDGGKVGFSSDIFGYSEGVRANPMLGMQVAMTRVEPWKEIRLDPEKYPGSVRPPASAKLSLEQLIHGYTAVNAERMRLDDKLGSLEAGKLANFVVFNEDIFDFASKTPENFGEIEPCCTYFEGEERHIVSTLKKIAAYC